MRRSVLFLLSGLFFSLISCEVGLGSAVDIAVPTVGISYPPKNAVIRDSFVISGICNDDSVVADVSVTLTNTQNNKVYGPYTAELSEDKQSWQILVNNKDESKVVNEFNSYAQWEIPDGSYIISAIATDSAKKKSQTATSPLSVDNTPPVLIVSKPLAIGSDIATVYGRSLKLSGDIAEDHETAKLVLYYREYDNSTDDFKEGSQVQSLEITDSAELNAMSSSNPLIIAKFDEQNPNSTAHQRYLTLYGQNQNNIDKYYYCGFMLEDNALVYTTPGDNGSGTGNQTRQYYLLSSDFQNVLSTNYSLTAPGLMDILKGQSEKYDANQVKSISDILLKQGNFASSFSLVDETETARETSSKVSLNPHNNPTWSLDEYGVSSTTTASQIKSYSAGSSLILTILAGRDASYPDPKTVKADFYDLGEYNPNKDFYNLSLDGITPISLIDPQGETKWDESADDSEKTYTFTLDTQEYGLLSKHIYRMIVTGTDRNKTDLEPQYDYKYMFNLSTSIASPKITLTDPVEDIVYGKEVNEDGVTIKGSVTTDGIPLKSIADKGVEISNISITNLDDGSVTTPDLTHYDGNVVSLVEEGHCKYSFEINLKAKTGYTFVSDEQSKYYYTVTVRANDIGETTPGERNSKFYVDNKQPDISIISVTPDDGTGFVNGKITISGIAADSGNTGSDLKSISYTIKNTTSGQVITGFEDVEIDTNESWSFDVSTKSLSVGTETSEDSFDFVVTAVDKVNNKNSAQRTVVVKQVNDRPVLDVSNANKNITNVENLSTSENLFPSSSANKLYGTIKDDDGIASVVATYKKVSPVGNALVKPLTAVKDLTPRSKLYDFEYELPSDQGKYEIVFQIKDIHAQEAEEDSSKKETKFDNLTHTFYVTIDDGAPVISLNSFTPTPVNANNSNWYMGSKGNTTKKLIVQGEVLDGNGFVTGSDGFSVTHSAVEPSTNTAPVNSLSLPENVQTATKKVFSDTITLPSVSGKYKATYKAKDVYEQEASYDFEYSVDVDEPVIDGNIKIWDKTVTPTATKVEGYITQSNITVEVTVYDNGSGIKAVSYSFDDPEDAENRSFTAMTNSSTTDGKETWTANVTFPDGKDVNFCIRVEDNVGNTFERNISADVDQTKPVLDVKWYQIKGATEADHGTVRTPDDTAYVNSKDIYIYGNYSDPVNGSGVNELTFKVGEGENATITPTVTYYTKSFDDPANNKTPADMVAEVINAKTTDAQGNVVDVNPYECAYSPENSTQIKSFVAVIDKSIFAAENFPDGILSISGSDKADNKIEGESRKVMKLKKDTDLPGISGIKLTKSYKDPNSTNTYFIRNKTDLKLTVEGTTTDNYGVDKTVLTVTGTKTNGDVFVYSKESTNTSWCFDDVDLRSCKSVLDSEQAAGPGNRDAYITITAFDKAGNTKLADEISLIFDEDKPAVLTGGEGGSDPQDSSNPYEAKYFLREKVVEKYNGIRIGNGTYSDASFGREASIPLTVTFVGEKLGSGIASIEYKMLDVSKVQELYSNNVPPTGNYSKYTGTVSIPADENCTKAGTMAIESSYYNHYNDNTDIPCTLGKATIGGFTSSIEGTPNIVFVRATDNCGNVGEWFTLLVQVDQSNPVNTNTNTQASLLTNGKSALQELTGTYKDEGAGLKALRVYVDGKVVIDGCLKGLSTPAGETSITIPDTDDTNKTLRITAKDKDGNEVAPSANNAVSVTFTNQYGSLTYDSYYKDKNNSVVKDSLANGATFADWKLNLTPQEGTWFNTLTNNKTALQVSIEAEDWAEDASGSGNKATAPITILDVDKTLPTSAITSPSDTESFNGTQTIKGTVGENHTPKSVSIYYTIAVESDGTLPAELKTADKLNSTDATTGWKLIKKISTDDAGVSVQNIYNFEVANVDFNSLIGKDAEGKDKVSGKVHVLVCSEDKAGNKNWADNDVTVNKNGGTAAYKTLTVDRNSDRPVVTVTSTDLVTVTTETNNGQTVTNVHPLSGTNYLPLEIKNLNFKVTDDDGVNEVKYRIIKDGQSAANVGWTPITDISAISTNGASIKFTDEGKQKVEFYIKDTKGGEFTSEIPAGGSALNTIYLADTENHKYGTTDQGYETPVIFVDVDTKPPVLKIEGVQYLPQGFDELSETEKVAAIAAAPFHTSGFSSAILGGPDSQYLRVKASASDEGSGVASVELSAKLDGENISENLISTATPGEDDDYYLVIPVLNGRADDKKKDNSSYVLTVKAKDKAGKEASDSITFKVDDKLPEITIKSPASTDNLSGACTVDGSVSETSTLWYTISPVIVSPDEYTDETEFSYDKYDENDVKTTVALSTEGLETICKYKEIGSSLMSFYLWLDGKTTSTTGIHSETLNKWIIDMGITTEEALSNPTNPFKDIVQLYFHVKAKDNAGNINERHYEIRLDPLGSRPQVRIGYPSEEKAGGTNSITLGGSPTIIGTASGTNAVDWVWLQVDCDGSEDGEWTEADFNKLVALKDSANNPVYELGNMSTKAVVTQINANNPVDLLAIKVKVSSQSWSQKININGELNPPEGSQKTRKVKIKAYATDVAGFTSSVETRNIAIDSDVPVIDQDIRLVQWAAKPNSTELYSGADAFGEENGVIKLSDDGKIQLKSGSTVASREYIENESIIGKWYAIGKVTDDSGIKSITYTVNGVRTEYAITSNRTSYTGEDADEGAYVRPIPSKKPGANDYVFCIPIGDDTPGKVGEYTIAFTAEENEESNPRSADMTFKVVYDNLAPVITESPVASNIVNSDGVYTFGGKATEDRVNNIAQTGVERIAFYFTRNVEGLADNEEIIFDPMIRINIDGNKQSYNGLEWDSGLYWHEATASGVIGTEVSLNSTPSDNVHVGGLAKINGVIYRIEGVDKHNNTVSLSGAPGDSTSFATILFAIANVVDNPTREGEGSTAIRDDYGWGYYSDGTYDDHDYMIESLTSEDTKYTWAASINSKNISDGPVTLHFVVFDKAGNASLVNGVEPQIECFVKNNVPRLAGVIFGTDENGNNEVDQEEFNSTKSGIFANGYSGTTKVTSLSIPTDSTAASPKSVLKIKGKTVIKPEIIGGNGDVSYTYSVSRPIEQEIVPEEPDPEQTEPVKEWVWTPYYTGATPIYLGKGTIDDNIDDANPDKDYTWNFEDADKNPIELNVVDLLTNLRDDQNKYIGDGEKQKFTFVISDSTPQTSQSATLEIVMDILLDDKTSAKNKIIPFYWESAKKNSLKDNNPTLGHIELSKDLEGTTLTRTPKVSGAVKLEGIAQDNTLLKELTVSISTYNSGNPITIASYNNGSWTGTAEITNATYGEYKAAGYINEIPAGIDPDETIPQVSQEYGHVVHWTMEIDTETMLGCATGIFIKAKALDKGQPSLNGGNVVYTSNKFDYNGDGTIPGGETEYVEPNPVVQSGGNNGTSAYTYNYQIDVVPYIRGIKTKLSTKSKKSDSSEYDRTALGHYPVAKTETVYLYGFNLTDGTLYDSENHSASLGDDTTINTYDSYKGFKLYPVSGISAFTSGPVYVKVGSVESINNKNKNDSKGSYDGTDYANYYNRKPNGNNNDTLTDDVELDVWNINSEAGSPSAGGRIDELTMKINPATAAKGIVGFAFLDGPTTFSRPKGNSNSYTQGAVNYSLQNDSHTTAALAYDTKGNAFSVSAGGNEGDPLHFEILPSDGGDPTNIYLEYVNQNKKRDNTGSYMDLRYKVRSPNIVTSPNGDDDTNIYMVYYDSFNDEIRYKYGSMNNIKNNKNGRDLFHPRTDNNADHWQANDANPYTCEYSQVIATDASTNLPSGVSYKDEPLGGAGEFVDIDVIPNGTLTGQTDDIAVVVWYDAKAKALKYAYNTKPRDYTWKNDSSINTEAKYRGLNKINWTGVKTIFTGAGEYCSVKVDGKGGIHIAAYDSKYGDLKYAYLSSYSATYNEATMSYTVDSAGNAGSHMRMDVALASDKTTPVPYISYYGSNMAKLAYPKVGSYATNGAEGDMFTGNWEVTYIPTESEIDDLDYKRLMNIDSRINVGVWKYIDAVTTGNNQHAKGQIKNSTTGTMSGAAKSGTFYGNGTANPLVSYSVLKDTANSRIETAQMQ